MESIVDIVRLDTNAICTKDSYSRGTCNFAIFNESYQDIMLDLSEPDHSAPDVGKLVVEPLDRAIVLKPDEGITGTAYFLVEMGDGCRYKWRHQKNKGAMIDLAFKVFQEKDAGELEQDEIRGNDSGRFRDLPATIGKLTAPFLLPQNCGPCITLNVRTAIYFPAKQRQEAYTEHMGNCFLSDRNYLCGDGQHHDLYCCELFTEEC